MSDYALAAADHLARARLDGAAAWIDPSTIEYLDGLGVARGWRCAEIGGGTGRPGGWLCLEEPDWIISGLSDPPTPAIERFWSTVAKLVSSRGGDPSVGRKIGAAVHDLGLTDIGGDARAVVARGALGPQLDTLGPVLTAAGLLSAEDLVAAHNEAATPGLTYTPLFVSVWGRRPTR